MAVDLMDTSLKEPKYPQEKKVMPTNLQECTLNRLRTGIMNITLLKGVQFYESSQSCAETYSRASSNEDFECDGSSGQREGQVDEFASMSRNKSQSKQEVIEQALKECNTYHFATRVDLCHFKILNWTNSSQNTQAVYIVATL